MSSFDQFLDWLSENWDLFEYEKREQIILTPEQESKLKL